MTETCDDDHQTRISLWLDGQLDAKLAQMVVRHLAECPDCKQFYAALRQLEALVDEAGMLVPRPGFTARFQARLAARQRARPRLNDLPGS